MTTEMSGEIFHPPDSLEDLDVARWNPLMCYLCNEKYEEPCILGCFHSFCSRCLRGRDVDGKMSCPLCGSSTQIKDGEELPPSDRLMKFLVESTGDEKEKCANCDNEFEQMFFCNTCNQPLCEACREETHRAKMFARHDIVVLSKRTKEIHRECAIHQEPYILFSTERKTMLCINCFRDMKVESRSYCVDLESAYSQGCKKLDQSMMAIKDLQNSVRDAILLLKVLLEEIEQNSEKEKTAVTELYDQLLEKITETKTSLIQEVDRQYESKETTFKAELVALSTLLPTLHTQLVTSAAFCSSANRFEFLDLAYVLMERLKTIIQLQHPLHPSQGSQIITDFKSMFAKCLEPLLFPPKITSVISSSSSISLTAPSNTTVRFEPVTTVSNTSPSHIIQYPQRRQTGYNSIKYKLIENKGVFAEHCTEFNTSHRELNSNTEKLKSLIQELQRDLTVRRCLAKMTAVSDLDVQIKSLQQSLDEHFTKNEQKQIFLEKHWEESVQRIATEQELYQAQLHDIIRLKQESEQLKTILTRMSSFVASIASVTERIAPKLGQTTKNSENDTKIAQIFEQINTMNPDSQQRVDAIKTAQEEREVLTAHRPNPLDEELIKTKGMLKAPSARKEVARKDSTKRNSREIKENVVVEEKHPDKIPQDKEQTELLNFQESKEGEVLTILNHTSEEQKQTVGLQKEEQKQMVGLQKEEQKQAVVLQKEEQKQTVFLQKEEQKQAVFLQNEEDASVLKTKLICKDTDVLDSRADIDVMTYYKHDLDPVEAITVDITVVHRDMTASKIVPVSPNVVEVLNQNLKKTLPVDTQCVIANDFILELNDEGKSCQNTQTITQLEEEKSGEKSSVVGNSFSLPKDFVASTIKGFENQKSPEKGDDSSIVVKRTRRTRKNKQSNDESQASEPQINGSHTENTQKHLPHNSEIQEVENKSENNNLKQTGDEKSKKVLVNGMHQSGSCVNILKTGSSTS